MCFAVSADAGELAQLALERHEVGDHLDGVDRRGVAVGPAASWFRLLPMRATCRVRSRSTSAAAAVQVRVRAMACRSRSDSGTPTTAAFARQSASSAGETRACTRTVRRSRIGAPPGRSGSKAGRSRASPAGPRDAGGSKVARSAPSPAPMYAHWGWLPPSTCRKPAVSVRPLRRP